MSTKLTCDRKCKYSNKYFQSHHYEKSYTSTVERPNQLGRLSFLHEYLEFLDKCLQIITETDTSLNTTKRARKKKTVVGFQTKLLNRLYNRHFYKVSITEVVDARITHFLRLPNRQKIRTRN